MLTKNAGMACSGAVRGLTRKRTIRREVVERRAERITPKSREFTLSIVLSTHALRNSLSLSRERGG
jgi:hypothetical protein